MAGRTVVVTGGGTGIGKAIATAFATDGEQVVILGRRESVLLNAVEEIRAKTSRAVLVRRCDVTDPVEVDSFVEWIVTSVSKTVDVVINNAAGADGSNPVTTNDAARLAMSVLQANLLGPFLMVHALRPHLSRPGGRIVNISSIAAFRGGPIRYAAAKAGLLGLTFALAQELGPEGITVNAVCPGLIAGTEYFGDANATPSAARVDSIVSHTLMGRTGRPEDIAAAVRYFASLEASYVTGEVLRVDGGSWSPLPHRASSPSGSHPTG